MICSRLGGEWWSAKPQAGGKFLEDRLFLGELLHGEDLCLSGGNLTWAVLARYTLGRAS